MKRSVLWGIAAVVVLAGALVLAPLFLSERSKPAGPAGLAGQPAPVFELQDDRGAKVSLEQYRGKVVVVNLWATWCPPCRAEMPDLQRLVDAYGAKGVVVVGVNQGESAERAREFAAALGIHFPVWIDSDQQYGRAFSALGMPTTAIVDENGTIVRAYDGALTYDQMRKAIEGLSASP